MLQVLAKKDDPFSGGRTYYSHPSIKDADKPKVPHQSSATGMQAIPATGVALGMHYREGGDLFKDDEKYAFFKDMGHEEDLINGKSPVVVCSLGDASVTEGEVAEVHSKWQFSKKLPILYVVQDNGWDISANGAGKTKELKKMLPNTPKVSKVWRRFL